MRALLISFLFALFLVAPAATAERTVVDAAAACAPPCGPIPVIITIKLEKSKNVEFDEAGKFETTGVVEFYYDIDDSGYAWDPNPQEEVWVNLKVAKAPAWTATTIEPTKFRVPIRPYDDPSDPCLDCVRPEGDLPQSQFLYEHPVKVSVQKLRDFDAAELKRWLKSDGTYRVTINAISNDSMAGHDAVGKPVGLQEGYGVKEIRFIAPKNPAPAGQDAAGTVAGPQVFGLLVAAVLAVALVRRRE